MNKAKHTTRHTRRSFGGKSGFLKRAAIFVIPFAVVGTIVLALGKAATPSSTFEPEAGQISSPAMVMNDSGDSGGSHVMFGAPNMNMEHIPLDQLPKGDPSRSSNIELISSTGGSATASGDGSGNARYICQFSHMNYDDPIVFPGQQGAAHLHVFFGNTTTNYLTTPANIRAQIDASHFVASSTCSGGAANLTAYWAPALMNGSTPVKPDADEFNYYKSGYRGVKPSDVHDIPAGFKMIAGNKDSLVGQSPDIVEWWCDPDENPSATPTQTIPQSCHAGQQLRLDITFPQCWDGVNTVTANLSDPTMQSHIHYPGTSQNISPPGTIGDYGDACTKETGHTVAIPVISIQIRYTVPAGGAGNLRLSSDKPNALPGASAHADFMEGWDPIVRLKFINNCIKGVRDTTRGLCNGAETLIDP